MIAKTLIIFQKITSSIACHFLRFRFCISPVYFLNLVTLGKGVVFNVPVRCDGWGKVYLHDFVTVGFRFAPKHGNGQVLIQARNSHAKIEIGQNTTLSNNVSIIAILSVSIGRDCLIGNNVTIFDSDFHDSSPATRHIGTGGSGRVIIGNNVWLGSGVTVLKGVTIGENSIVSANSLCHKNIPKNVIVAGNPAIIIGEL